MISSTLENESPENAILGMAQGFILSRIIMLFAELDFVDIFSDSSVHISDIANHLGVDINALRRFLRLLSAHKIIVENETDYFCSTLLLQQLKKVNVKYYIHAYNILDTYFNAIVSRDLDCANKIAKDVSQILNGYLNLQLTTKKIEAQVILSLYLNQFVLSRIVIAAAELKIQHLLAEPDQSELLHTKCFMQNEVYTLFIQILIFSGIIKIDSNKKLSNADKSLALDWVLSPHIIHGYKAFNDALHTLKYDKNAWTANYGKPFYIFLSENHDALKNFENWCNLSAKSWLQPILKHCFFPKDEIIVDIGGGTGHFISATLENNKHLSGILFDQAGVIAHIKPNYFNAEIKKRLHLVAGDFFQAVPENGDIYTICRTLLNWPDQQCIEIINNCYSASRSYGKIKIIDFLIPEKNHAKYPRAVVNDISLFVIFGSAIRCQSEWINLINKSNFHFESLSTTKETDQPVPYYPMCIIDAVRK